MEQEHGDCKVICAVRSEGTGPDTAEELLRTFILGMLEEAP